MGPWCGVEAKPLVGVCYSTLGLERPNGRLGDPTLELIVA